MFHKINERVENSETVQTFRIMDFILYV
jgi:hypothetical protein